MIILAVLTILEVGVEPDTAGVEVRVAPRHHFLRAVYVVVNYCPVEVLT